MKRFKDCIITCISGQKPADLLNIIGNECQNNDIRVEFSSSFSGNDTIGAYVDFEGLPASKFVLHAAAEKNGVAILNIVPLPKSGESMLDIPTYNALLDTFCERIFRTVSKRQGNVIEENTEDYSIEEIIPKSFQYLNRWLNAYPLSHHPLDEHRWYDFLISLINTDEHVGSSVLSDYIKENYHWTEKELFELELRYESQLDLLEYYVGRR